MKSRWTTYLLLAAVVAVWGVVGWRILAPSNDVVAPPTAHKPITEKAPPTDTLLLDYPDPFLRENTVRTTTPRTAVRSLPAPTPKVHREKIRIQLIGTVATKGRTLYILTIGNEQYEIGQGETAGEFTLTGCDSDSIYLNKQGLTYGVKRCE